MASGDQLVQAKYETTTQAETGGAVATATFFHPQTSFNLFPSRLTDDRSDEMRGTSEAVPLDTTGYNGAEGSTSGRAYPNVLGLYLTLVAGAPVTTAGAASGVLDPDAGVIPVGATRHVWDSATLDVSTVKTAQFQYQYGNNTGVWAVAKGVSAPSLTLNVGTREETGSFDCDLQALYWNRLTSDPAMTATFDALSVLPFNRGHFSVPTWLTGSGAIQGGSFTFENPFEIDDSLAASASSWPTAWQRPVQAGAVPRLRGTLNLRSVDPQDIDAFLAGTTFTYKVKWLHTLSIGATSYKYSMWIEGAASYDDYTPGELAHQLRIGADVNFLAGKVGATQAFKVTLVNGVTAYTT